VRRYGALLIPAILVSTSCAEQGGDPVDAQMQPVANVTGAEEAPVASAPESAPEAIGRVEIAGAPPAVQAVINTYCIDCHGQDQQKGDVRFDTLGTLDEAARTELFTTAHQVLEFEEMPPDNKPQPSEDERAALIEWVQSQVDSTTAAAAAAELEDKLRYPHYGNLVDHEALFSGEIHEHAFTPARRWLVSPQIFQQRVMEVFRLEARDRSFFETRQFYGVTNPFILPDDSGVRDYDIGTLTGGHLLIMLNNAQWIAGKQIFAAQLEIGDRDALLAGLSTQDRWYPRMTPEPFAAVMRSEGTPTEEQMIAAIQEQFDCVLRRQATDDEVQRYLGLLGESIALGGNTEGLKRMLVAVLLESEFLYRMEFGSGDEDEFGRRMLTPREGAYAISYALGDRCPDDALMQAAAEGRLQTHEDYEREVRRLLADEDYYRGQVDPALSSRHYQSNVTSHPRAVRFFREFFGYPNATKVFKDLLRSGGYYVNPGRGTLATPGRLIQEADMLVAYYLDQDRDVFENLIGGNLYFVAPTENAQETIDALNRIYDRFAQTNWEEDFEQIAADNSEWLQQQLHQSGQPRDFRHVMEHTEHFRELGLTPSPNWRYPFGFRMLTPWTKSYSIDPTQWDYPVEQPFVIENRRGILSHPAWLVAHSTNFHSDPIRRGRWVREKLLAGRVPDVPITVDAVVPEDPEHTFRHRVEGVTTAEACWGCHQHMNPLGLPFEIYDDFGRYRTVEDLEHPDNLISEGNPYGLLPVYPTAPVDSSGAITETGIAGLDGEVENSIEMLERLAESDLARQSIIRHAFRFYMGRNERLSDSQSLIDADRAYIQSGGSFEAVIVSLLTSDSFIYRKDTED